jgi:hypothetical protein
VSDGSELVLTTDVKTTFYLLETVFLFPFSSSKLFCLLSILQHSFFERVCYLQSWTVLELSGLLWKKVHGESGCINFPQLPMRRRIPWTPVGTRGVLPTARHPPPPSKVHRQGTSQIQKWVHLYSILSFINVVGHLTDR